MRGFVIAMIVAAASSVAEAGELCEPNARRAEGPSRRYRGAVVDLDVKGAELHDVYRLLSEVGRVNIVLPDDVTGKVTVRLKRVPWDQVACTVAAMHRLAISVDGNVLLVTKRPPAK